MYFINLFSEKVNLTEFLQKKCGGKILKFPHCAVVLIWKIFHETAIPETAEAACTKLKTRILPVQIKFEMYWKY